MLGGSFSGSGRGMVGAGLLSGIAGKLEKIPNKNRKCC